MPCSINISCIDPKAYFEFVSTVFASVDNSLCTAGKSRLEVASLLEVINGKMANGQHLYSAFIQSAVQCMPLIHPFTHPFTHQR